MEIIVFVIFYAIIGIIIAKLAVLVGSKMKFSEIYNFFVKLLKKQEINRGYKNGNYKIL